MKTFPLKISTPEGDVFNQEVVKISARGTEGEFAVMAGHIPFVTAVKECNCKIETPDGEEKIGHTEGGLISVSAKQVLFLSGSFHWVD
ncbi:MAG: F0F1 ATP synthase subunit epsilon [Clostridia bacterium]|nr:F0F1 ATP synthase subunit epsilon [Clostridia bacterium]